MVYACAWPRLAGNCRCRSCVAPPCTLPEDLAARRPSERTASPLRCPNPRAGGSVAPWMSLHLSAPR
eukprot:scaffold170600_cov31-Tisochrysis_lutea.AAC.4